MADRPNLLIHAGPDAGLEIRVTTAEGIRLGRSTKNDVVLNDPKTSRYHCRFYLKPGVGLFVADLGSANQTLVNNEPIREVRLSVADLVTLGDTVIKVIEAGVSSAAALPPPAPGAPSPTDVDLGLQSEPDPDEPTKAAAQPAPKSNQRRPWTVSRLITVLAMILLCALAIWLPRFVKSPDKSAAPDPALLAAALPSLEITYEKVLANTNRIFRYALHLSPGHKLAVNVDDTDATHFREQGTLRDELITEIARLVEQSGFMALENQYQGIQANALDQWDITVTLGRQTHHCRVVNRAEPPEFKSLREKLENVAQLELGLWAVQYPPDKLIDMANQAYLDGKKLFDERDIKHGNLATAIHQLKDADFFLKTIEPKPAFYADLLARLAQFATELDRRYVEQNFLANRAMRAKDMPQAAQELRVLCDMLGDRADPRYTEAWNKLLEVESRLNLEKK